MPGNSSNSVRSMSQRRVIVNADDFGMSTSVNDAIAFAFRHRLISGTSIMTNMPGFEEACTLARRLQFVDRIGVHLNLTEGKPLTDAITQCPRFCAENGMFRRYNRLFLILSREESIAVEAELEAQIQTCLSHGIVPTHLDSHHHFHTRWGVGTAALKVARKYAIRAVRISRNCGSGISSIKRTYKVAFNQRLRFYKVARTRHFGSARDVQSVLKYPGRLDVEVMVHPRRRHDGLVTDEDGDELEAVIRRLGLDEVP